MSCGIQLLTAPREAPNPAHNANPLIDQVQFVVINDVKVLTSKTTLSALWLFDTNELKLKNRFVITHSFQYRGGVRCMWHLRFMYALPYAEGVAIHHDHTMTTVAK